MPTAGIAYVERETLEAAGERWLERIGPSRRRAAWRDPTLLVIDMQRYFLDPSSHAYLPAGEVIVDNVIGLARAFRDAGRLVIPTVHAQEEGDEGEMGQWWGEVIRPGAWADLDDRVRDSVGPPLVKRRYSAFCGTDLGARLGSGAVPCTVVVCGVMTHACCLATAMEAFCRDHPVVMVADALASTDEERHVGALGVARHAFAEVITSRQVEHRLRTSS